MSDRNEDTKYIPESELESAVNDEGYASEANVDEVPADEAPAAPIKPIKKKKSTLKKILIALAILLALLLLLIGGALFAIDRYVDHMLGYISYEESDEEWSGVDIDDPSYGIEDEMGIDTSGFVDPEAGTDTDPNVSVDDTSYDDEYDDEYDDDDNNGNGGGNGGNYVPPPPEPPYEPDYEILEGLFDGDTVTDVYDKDVINILLIGADTISGKSARSDTMILMSINNVKKRIVFTSFMRDTYVKIPGRKDNRLNAAFAAGGPNLLIQTIKLNFDINIDHYVMVGLSSFEQAVNAIGGIDITINNDNYDFFKTWDGIYGLSQAKATDGTHKLHLTGSQALVYARSRAFSNGDFTRTLHQRDLLKQFALQLRTKSLSDIHELLKTVLPYVKTNIPKDKLRSMIWNALTYISYNITDARVPCPGSFQYAKINGREVLSVNLEANKKYIKAKIYG